MSIVVEHEKRMHEILRKALDVFMEEGYEAVTIQKIAARCGITRTTLYIYFRNKREIFNFSIKQLLSGLENDITEIKKETGLRHTDKLIRVMTVIIERLEENRRLLTVIQDFLVHLSKSGHDPGYRVRRRTVRLRHILTTMLIEGKRAGEFKPQLIVKDANSLLYTFLEASGFRLVILKRDSSGDLKAACKLAVEGFAL